MSLTTSSDTTSDTSGVRRGRKESPVWEHFIKEAIGSGHYSAKCYYCAQTWSRGRPEVLKSHLALVCNEAPLNIKLKYMEMLATESRRQDSNTGSSTEVESRRSDKIDQALIRFFICCGISFSTVDHPYFVDFVQSLCFSYNPPKRTTLSTAILNKEISVILEKINEELKHEENLTLGKYYISFILNLSTINFI
jgi:hypothetical protein